MTPANKTGEQPSLHNNHCNIFILFTADARRAQVVIKSRCVSVYLCFLSHFLWRRRATSPDIIEVIEVDELEEKNLGAHCGRPTRRHK